MSVETRSSNVNNRMDTKNICNKYGVPLTVSNTGMLDSIYSTYITTVSNSVIIKLNFSPESTKNHVSVLFNTDNSDLEELNRLVIETSAPKLV